jgi:hypothetical protein
LPAPEPRQNVAPGASPGIARHEIDGSSHETVLGPRFEIRNFLQASP